MKTVLHMLLFRHGVNFNDLPSWQKRGVGLVWEAYEKVARNPKMGEDVTVQRRRIRHELELPMRDEYGVFVAQLLGAP